MRSRSLVFFKSKVEENRNIIQAPKIMFLRKVCIHLGYSPRCQCFTTCYWYLS